MTKNNNKSKLTKILGIALVLTMVLSIASPMAMAVDSTSNGSVSPSNVDEGTTTETTIESTVSGISGDSVEDVFYVEFDEDYANEISESDLTIDVTDTSDGSSVPLESSGTLVDRDDDGLNDSIKFGINPSSATDVNISVTTNITHPWVDTSTGYDVNLTVDDSDGSSLTNTVGTISVSNVNDPPTFDVDSQQAVEPNETFYISPSNVDDPDNDSVSFTYVLVDENGTVQKSLGSGDSLEHNFSETGTYYIAVSGSDGDETTLETVTVNVSNAPTFDLTQTSYTVNVGDSVTIDPSNVDDPDNDSVSLSYWLDDDATDDSVVYTLVEEGDSYTYTQDEEGTVEVRVVAEDENGVQTVKYVTIEFVSEDGGTGHFDNLGSWDEIGDWMGDWKTGNYVLTGFVSVLLFFLFRR